MPDSTIRAGFRSSMVVLKTKRGSSVIHSLSSPRLTEFNQVTNILDAMHAPHTPNKPADYTHRIPYHLMLLSKQRIGPASFAAVFG
jgi:hypothetical protein